MGGETFPKRVDYGRCESGNKKNGHCLVQWSFSVSSADSNPMIIASQIIEGIVTLLFHYTTTSCEVYSSPIREVERVLG